MDDDESIAHFELRAKPRLVAVDGGPCNMHATHERTLKGVKQAFKLTRRGDAACTVRKDDGFSRLFNLFFLLVPSLLSLFLFLLLLSVETSKHSIGRNRDTIEHENGRETP